MSQKLCVWDTCSYVRRFREPEIDAQILRHIRQRRFVLSSVVAMELYAGSRDRKAKSALDVLIDSFNALGLLITPGFDDYRLVGVAIRNYTRRHGALDPGHHFRDALLVCCASRLNGEILTENLLHLNRWERELRRLTRVRVAVSTP